MKYVATLNGKKYEVEIERVDEYRPLDRGAQASAPAPILAAAPAPKAAPAAAATVCTARWQAAAVPVRTNSNRPQKGQYSPNGRYCPFLWGRQVFTVLVCYFQPEHDRIAGNGRFCLPSEVFPRGTAREFPCIEDNL